MKADYSRPTSIAIITVVYVIAVVAGVAAYTELCSSMPDVRALLVSDAIATVVVWLFGLVFRNVSVYDPYWSVAPPVMFSLWAMHKGFVSLPTALLLIAVWFWGIRLTTNWAFIFKGLSHED